MKESIYQYENYREYLRDFLEEKRTQDSKYSQRYFTQKMGIKSTGFLSEVVSGKRSITDLHLARLIEIIALKGSERDYFENLVRFNQAKHLDDRDYYFQKMLSFKVVKSTELEKSQYEYYSEWYHTAIRELLWFENEKVSAAQIAKRLEPSISISQAESSLNLLLSLGFIKKEEKGYKVLDLIVSSNGETRAQEVLKYQGVTLDLAKEALSKISVLQREINTLSFSLSKQGFEKMRDLLEVTQERALQIAQQDANEEKVYQLNLQLFPMSK